MKTDSPPPTPVAFADSPVPAPTVDVCVLEMFPSLVRELGGNSAALLRSAGIDHQQLGRTGGLIDFRAYAQVLNLAAVALSCPEFGMRLASLQARDRMLGPLGVILHHARTLGDALYFCAAHTAAHSRAIRVELLPQGSQDAVLIQMSIGLEPACDLRQVIEQTLLVSALTITRATGGTTKPQRVQLAHPAAVAPAIYRRYFGRDVAFDSDVNGLILARQDFARTIEAANPTIYEMASAFIEARFPRHDESIVAMVRQRIRETLGSEHCTFEQISASLSLHPRTLQRRLRSEGTSFADIKDEVRKEVALHYLHNRSIPLKRIAIELGYAEPSVFSRSCYRWFSESPRQVRTRIRTAGPGAVAQRF